MDPRKSCSVTSNAPVQAVNAALQLSAGRPLFEPHFADFHAHLQLGDALDTNILQRVLYASVEVAEELLDGAFVNDCTRNTLSDLDFVAFGEVPG